MQDMQDSREGSRRRDNIPFIYCCMQDSMGEAGREITYHLYNFACRTCERGEPF